MTKIKSKLMQITLAVSLLSLVAVGGASLFIYTRHSSQTQALVTQVREIGVI